MNFTVILPHYKNGELTELSIRRMLEHKGQHEIDIIVVNNNPGDGTEHPFLHHVAHNNNVRYYEYPKHMLSNIGTAYDWVMHMVKTDYFITATPGSRPTNTDWLDAYAYAIRYKYAVAGGFVHQFDSGFYLHPCGAFYKTSVYQEALDYAKSQKYVYYGELVEEQGQRLGLIIPEKVNDTFMALPHTFIKGLDYPSSIQERREKFQKMAAYYKPFTLPFASHMGYRDERIEEKRERNFQTDAMATLTLYDNIQACRIGYDPGQWFSYWLAAKAHYIEAYPVSIKENDNGLEYSLMSNGFECAWQ